jgi:hypothetical protein
MMMAGTTRRSASSAITNPVPSGSTPSANAKS